MPTRMLRAVGVVVVGGTADRPHTHSGHQCQRQRPGQNRRAISFLHESVPFVINSRQTEQTGCPDSQFASVGPKAAVSPVPLPAGLLVSLSASPYFPRRMNLSLLLILVAAC